MLEAPRLRQVSRPAPETRRLSEKGRLMDAAAIAALVYVIDADHGVKIGITRFADVGARARDLERSAGQSLRILRTWPFTSAREAYDVERCAHALLADDRTIGEWFHTHPLVACATIDSLVARGNASAIRIRLDIDGVAA